MKSAPVLHRVIALLEVARQDVEVEKYLSPMLIVNGIVARSEGKLTCPALQRLALTIHPLFVVFN